MARILALVAVFLVVACVLAAPSEPTKPKPKADPVIAVQEGLYVSQGSEGDGRYKGMVMVKKFETNYVVIYAVGNSYYRGTGVMEDGKFIVAWASQGATGLTIYRVGDTKLSGRWTALPKGDGTEELRFIEPLE